MKNSLRHLATNVKDSYKLNGSVEIVNASKVIVEEISKIIDYSNTKVVIDIGKNILVINGIGLNVCDYFNKNTIKT